MAKLPTTKRILKEDLRGSPDWVNNLLQTTNTNFEFIYSACNGRLTFGDNVQAQKKSITFTTSDDYSSGTFTTLKFPSTLKTRAEMCTIMQIQKDSDIYDPIMNGVSLDWREINGEIQIGFVTGLEDSTTYILKVLVT